MNTSNFLAGGAQLQVKAGSSAINAGDLVIVGGPGTEAYTAATIDYARIASSGPLAAPAALTNAVALPVGVKAQLARDQLGNIFSITTNSSGNLVVNKTNPLGGNLVSAVLDAASATNTPKLFQLSNGTFCVVYARAAGIMQFVIFDGALNILVASTAIVTEFAASGVVYHDAIPLAVGGFAVAYQTSAGTGISLGTYTNGGVVVHAASNIATLASTAAQEYIAMVQLPSGNIAVAYRGTMTSGGNAGTSFVIVTTAAAAVAGPTSVDTTSTLGFLSISTISGGTSLAIAVANGTNFIVGAYNQTSGALLGSKLTIADTLNSVSFPQAKLVNDGSQYWACYVGSAAAGVNVVQLLANGVGSSQVNGLASASVTNLFGLDAEVINGLLVVIAASSTTGGQFWLTVGLPDASIGIGLPYLRTGATVLGSVAATAGSRWPRVMSSGGGLYVGTAGPNSQPANPSINGDFTAIFAYDQTTTAATFLAIQKVESSAIVGVAVSSDPYGAPGTGISINPGPGGYITNSLAGTSGLPFNHTANSPEGSLGVLQNIGVFFGSTSLGVSNSPTSPFPSTLANQTVGAGFMGVFGSGNYQIFTTAGANTFTVPQSMTPAGARIRVVGGGGGAKNLLVGGGGGGYAHGTFQLGAPGTAYAVTVGAAGVGGASATAGGTSSFGNLISATGGATNGVQFVANLGGVGIGGSFQANGGASVGGGGGAGSQLGPGGSTTTLSSGGGAPGGVTVTSGGGGSPFGSFNALGNGSPDIVGNFAVGAASASIPATASTVNAILASIRFPFDSFTSGGGGGGSSVNAPSAGGMHGGGGGGVNNPSGSFIGANGGNGSGGGGSPGASGNVYGTTGTGGNGGIGGGGGLGASVGGNGGPGLVIVEW